MATEVDVKTGWQPIETAPKDGSEMLLWSEGAGLDLGSWCGCGRYHSRTKERPAHYDEAWGSRGSLYISPQPTHWMPLPDTPE